MRTYTLKRSSLPDRNAGLVQLQSGKVIKTIELPWRNNEVGESCIPEGRYLVKRDKHGRHAWFKIMDVKGRTAIEWHIGTKPEHSEGCILSNLIEMQDLMIDTKGQDFYLDIKS